jgi:hypothetical protein
MGYEIPHADNPYANNGQSELSIAWEQGWMKCNDSLREHFAETSKWAVEFRQSVRNALFEYYPNNPCSTDEELINAINRLVKSSKITRKEK